MKLTLPRLSSVVGLLPSRRCLRIFLAWGLALGLLVGCSSKKPQVPFQQLPVYTTKEARLFDDSLAVEIFEPGLEPSLEIDSKLSERARRADQIVPVRLLAVSTRRAGDSVRYQLLVSPTGAPLVGDPLPDPFELPVRSASPSQGYLRTMDTQIVGGPIILLLRHYRHKGTRVVHFRAEPDSVVTRKTLEDALTHHQADSP